MKEYLAAADAVLDAFSSNENGLDSREASKRLAENGPNKLKEAKKTSLIVRFLHELANPMIIILLAAAAISAATSIYSGEPFTDVIIILAVVIINAVLGMVQESKAEKAIEALQAIAAATSKVVRDGRVRIIKSEELVTGDVILLEAGDAVPADARILESASLKIEEAALTGESVPVDKQTAPIELGGSKDIPLGDRANMAYMGSTVVYGRGRAVVTATGMNTEVGKIAGVLAMSEEGETPLQRKLSQLSRMLSFLVIGICAVVFIIDILQAYPDITGAAMLDTFMIAVSLAVAAIPEGLAAVVTIVLSIGVTKMSKRSAIVRRLTAVETLGCTQIICSDKTGTLTQNKMTVVEYAGADKKKLAAAMSLCSDSEPDETGSAIGEPTESALVNYAASLGLGKPELKEKLPRIGEAPFDSVRKMMSTVHKAADGTVIQFTKGAPDEVLKACTHALTEKGITELTAQIRESIVADNKNMADRALRVLCAAQRLWEAPPESYEAGYLEKNLCYIGLCGMIDPVRPEVIKAIDDCREAGIRPIMITGDHKDTAVAIAGELGIIKDASEAISGFELNDIADDELPDKIELYSVYARVQPEHKVRIVKAWQAKGKVTAMTGDGVNDAPSIKNADIGIGMGITGTDVTKNVADIVLADDNFATIVAAVAEGRRIYANIQKVIQYLLASNLAEVLAIFAATLLGFTILRPVHLLWINLITDSFPGLALGMEEAEPDSMSRPPRDPREGVLSGGIGIDVAVQGLFTTLITIAAYFTGHFFESGLWEIAESPDGMTMAFLTLSLAEIFHSFNMRSRRNSIFKLPGVNKYLLGAMLLSLIMTIAVIYVPFLSSAFGFEPVSGAEFAISVGLALTIIPFVELIKLLQRWIMRRK
ncbi:MAG: cation-translocating P-type ATPase [Clostridiales bacterium]|nr:cation-translocating P-type ATPase [Clostridiales bacterium]